MEKAQKKHIIYKIFIRSLFASATIEFSSEKERDEFYEEQIKNPDVLVIHYYEEETIVAG